MSEIVYDVDEQPAEILDDVISSVEKGKRKVLRDADPESAGRNFQRARQTNIKLISAIQLQYGLNKQEVKQHVGRDIEAINDSLMDISAKMRLASVEQEKFGEAEITTSVLMDIEQVKMNLESFHDLMQGIEDGEAMIQNE